MIDVLLVDDDQAILGVTQTYLESDGDIYAKTACSALEAVKVLSLWDYDLIISDQAMPGGTGLDLLRALRRRGNRVPFILFTAKDSDDLETEARALGACGFVEKGANLKDKLPRLKRMAREVTHRARSPSPDQAGEGHLKSLMDTYIHDDDGLEVEPEWFQDPVPSWMRGPQPLPVEDDGGDAMEGPYVTMAMLANVPAKRLRKGAVALPSVERIPAPDKSRLAVNGSGARFGGGLKLLREDVGLREAQELIPFKNEPRYGR